MSLSPQSGPVRRIVTGLRSVARFLPRSWKEGLRRGWRTASRWRRWLKYKRMPRLLPPTSACDIVVFPVIDWDFRFQRPQQLAREMAALGHRVFYLRTELAEGDYPRVVRVEERIGVVTLPGGAFNLYQDRLAPGAVKSCLEGLATLRAGFQLEEVLCLVQFPSWRPLIEALQQRWQWSVVYDCMDDHGGFMTNGDSIQEEEAALVAVSDLVVATSQVLFARWEACSARALLLPNATDFEHFRHPAAEPSALRGLERPFIGYFGAIAEWFDGEMVASAAAARPDWQFILIGDTFSADVSMLKPLRNVHLLGERPYEDLPGYLYSFDAAIIPFRRTPLTEATNPVKFYEYLSAGKPVVAVALPELAAFTDLFYPVRSSSEFVSQLEAALAESSPAVKQARIELAGCNTWRARASQLSEAIRAIYPRVAIVIVSYTDAGTLRMCLESIFAKTQYPNFEVVVVDNSGVASVHELLNEQVRQRPNLKVVFNERNIGFPRGVNVGIEAAGACDCLALLNDDTVVTRGWLGKLLRHLQTPGVELVGPVTNWAGNEARIEVDYRSLDEMEEFAAAYSRRHEGIVWDIPMQALYCVIMRRDLLDRIGLLDERFGIGMFEDDDFSRRVREAGGRVVCAEDVFIHHWGRSSFGAMEEQAYRRLFDENREKFEAKWGEPWRPHSARRPGEDLHRPLTSVAAAHPEPSRRRRDPAA